MRYKIWSCLLLLVGLTGGLLPDAVAQRNWYVATGGDDAGNDCQNDGLPCASIAYALAQAATNAPQAGDTIHVASGIYTEFDLRVGRNVIFSGAGATTTILQAATDLETSLGRVLTVSNNAAIRMEGFTIRHGRTSDGENSEGVADAGGNGGGILVNGSLDLVNCRVVSNRTGRGGTGLTGGRGGDGGGIYCDGSLLLRNSVVAFNQTGDGGAGTNAGGRAGNGWGIHNTGLLEIYDSTIHENAGGGGGSASIDGGNAGQGALWNSGRLILYSSTVSENTGSAGGVGTNGVNGSDSQGGALWNGSVGTATVVHATSAGNQAAIAESFYNVDGGMIFLDHSVIADGSVGAFDLLGPVLMQNTNGAVLSGDVAHLIGDVDPLLGGLEYLGGDTPVCRLKPLSLAVNAGDPAITNAPAADQRGLPRIQGGRIDLGAYELQAATLYVGEFGSDGTNECRDAAEPCASLSHAIPQALPDDMIQLTTGTVTDAGVEVDRPLTIAGYAATVSIWQAASDPEAASDRLFSILPDVAVALRDLTLRHGHAPDGSDADDGEAGGAVYNEGNLIVERCEVSSNRAGDGGPDGGVGGIGGAIYNNGTLQIDTSRFISNSAGMSGMGAEGGGGGAIYNDSSLAIADSEFAFNEAGAGGDGADGGKAGAVYNAGLFQIGASTFAANQAGLAGTGGVGGSGGAIYNEDTLKGTNITISGNQTGPGGRGGGIANDGFITLQHSTIAFNEATAPDGSAGGVDAAGPLTELGHVILSDNAADADGPDGEGALESLGYNLISDSASFTVNGELTGNLLDVSAELDPLSDNGGPTRTHALGLSSPAREAGDPSFVAPPDTDQRGWSRVVGPRIDMGSFEAELADSDGDGLPDYWENLFGLDRFDPGTTNVDAGAMGDPDSDFTDNISEYIAGTSPSDPMSVFKATSIQHPSGVVIRFPSASGRLYSLQSASSVSTSGWTNVTGQVDLPGSGGTDTVSHTTSDARVFYRLSVRLP